MIIECSNIFRGAGAERSGEIIETLLQAPGCRLERIVSNASCTPAGEWFDQERNEWVIVLSGSARIRFEDPAAEVQMKRGDYLTIPARRRHRVEWTSTEEATVWLALHYSP